MPKKGAKVADRCASPVRTQSGEQGRPGTDSPSDTGNRSSPTCSSQAGNSSVSPEKAVQSSAGRPPRAGGRFQKAPEGDGDSVDTGKAARAQRKKPAARGKKIAPEDAALSCPEFAALSAARPTPARRILEATTEQATKLASTKVCAAPTKAAPQRAARGASAASVASSNDCVPVDEHTQDAAGQEAAPSMLFRVCVCFHCVCANADRWACESVGCSHVGTVVLGDV